MTRLLRHKWILPSMTIVVLVTAVCGAKSFRPLNVLSYDKEQLIRVWTKQMSQHIGLSDEVLKERADLFSKSLKHVIKTYPVAHHAILIKRSDAPKEATDVTKDLIKEIGAMMHQHRRALL